jgi:hypothetical protein
MELYSKGYWRQGIKEIEVYLPQDVTQCMLIEYIFVDLGRLRFNVVQRCLKAMGNRGRVPNINMNNIVHPLVLMKKDKSIPHIKKRKNPGKTVKKWTKLFDEWATTISVEECQKILALSKNSKAPVYYLHYYAWKRKGFVHQKIPVEKKIDLTSKLLDCEWNTHEVKVEHLRIEDEICFMFCPQGKESWIGEGTVHFMGGAIREKNDENYPILMKNENPKGDNPGIPYYFTISKQELANFRLFRKERMIQPFVRYTWNGIQYSVRLDQGRVTEITPGELEVDDLYLLLWAHDSSWYCKWFLLMDLPDKDGIIHVLNNNGWAEYINLVEDPVLRLYRVNDGKLTMIHGEEPTSDNSRFIASCPFIPVRGKTCRVDLQFETKDIENSMIYLLIRMVILGYLGIRIEKITGDLSIYTSDFHDLPGIQEKATEKTLKMLTSLLPDSFSYEVEYQEDQTGVYSVIHIVQNE